MFPASHAGNRGSIPLGANYFNHLQPCQTVVVPLASKGLLRSKDVRLGEKILVAGYTHSAILLVTPLKSPQAL
tara:strand:+ start:169 stop:387 length:219 start_codon:yes stop_codon:yes gene_type:complete